MSDGTHTNPLRNNLIIVPGLSIMLTAAGLPRGYTTGPTYSYSDRAAAGDFSMVVLDQAQRAEVLSRLHDYYGGKEEYDEVVSYGLRLPFDEEYDPEWTARNLPWIKDQLEISEDVRVYWAQRDLAMVAGMETPEESFSVEAHQSLFAAEEIQEEPIHFFCPGIGVWVLIEGEDRLLYLRAALPDDIRAAYAKYRPDLLDSLQIPEGGKELYYVRSAFCEAAPGKEEGYLPTPYSRPITLVSWLYGALIPRRRGDFGEAYAPNHQLGATDEKRMDRLNRRLAQITGRG